MSHLFASLEAAARLVVKQDGYRPGSINRERWATTSAVNSPAHPQL
jgi:hypothetical protein